MYDKNGIHVQETVFEITPAIAGIDKSGKAVPGTWEHFPDTDEARLYIQTIQTPSLEKGYRRISMRENDEWVDKGIESK